MSLFKTERIIQYTCIYFFRESLELFLELILFPSQYHLKSFCCFIDNVLISILSYILKFENACWKYIIIFSANKVQIRVF